MNSNPNLVKLKSFLTLQSEKKVDIYNHVIMIHELSLELMQFFKFNQSYFHDCIFTFDDGLYSQFYSFEKFNNLFPDNPKFYFISTNILCKERNFKQKRHVDCFEAHRAVFEDDNLNAYMKVSQVKELSKKENVYIGGHGHNHLRANNNVVSGNLKDRYLTWIFDFKRMVDWFKVNDLPLDIYCTPYNEYNYLFHGGAKKHFPEIEIIGPNRITPMELLKLKKEK